MMHWYGSMFGAYNLHGGWDLATLGPGFIILLIILAVWSITWKIFGLWHSARDGKKWWLVAFFFLNTLGILEILYLYVFRDANGKKFNWRKPFHD
jgi:hypothetical protein